MTTEPGFEAQLKCWKPLHSRKAPHVRQRDNPTHPASVSGWGPLTSLRVGVHQGPPWHSLCEETDDAKWSLLHRHGSCSENRSLAGKPGTAHRTNHLRNVFAVLLSHHEEWSNAICSNMDGPRDDRTKGTKSEKHMLFNVTYMWNLNYNTNQYNLWTKNRLTDIENSLVVAKGAGVGSKGLRTWGAQRWTVIYRKDKQQGPTIQHRELYPTSCDIPQWKRIWKRIY